MTPEQSHLASRSAEGTMDHGCSASAPGQWVVLGPPRGCPDLIDASAHLGSALVSLAALASHLGFQCCSGGKDCPLLFSVDFRVGFSGFIAPETSRLSPGMRGLAPPRQVRHTCAVEQYPVSHVAGRAFFRHVHVCSVKPLRQLALICPLLASCSPSFAKYCWPLAVRPAPTASMPITCHTPAFDQDINVPWTASGGQHRNRPTQSWVSTVVEGLQGQLECFLRSLVLLYFCAVARVFARAFRLRKDTPKRNGAVRTIRACTRGAPVWLAFAAVAYLITPCHAMQSSDAVPMRGLHDPMPFEVPAPAVNAPGPAQPSRFRASSRDADLRARACVFRFQRSPLQAVDWVGPEEGVNYTCRAFHDDLFDSSTRCRLVPAFPQPSVDFLVFLEAPFWLTDMMLTPVLIEVFPEPVSRFVEVFAGRITLADLRHSVGDKGHPMGTSYGLYFVADAAEALGPDEVLRLQPGTLIRVLPPHLPRPRCVTLAEKLQCPRRWFRPADSDPPDDFTERGGIGVVGQWGDWCTSKLLPAASPLPISS